MIEVKPVKVCRRLYELRGVKCKGELGRPCGGQVFAEWMPAEEDGDERYPASWECYCDKCKSCDPNGWPTLKDCVREAPGFWTR